MIQINCLDLRDLNGAVIRAYLAPSVLEDIQSETLGKNKMWSISDGKKYDFWQNSLSEDSAYQRMFKKQTTGSIQVSQSFNKFNLQGKFMKKCFGDFYLWHAHDRQ